MKLSLSSNDILNKEFNKKANGYDPLEVDQFLDQILDDYRIMDDVILNLNNRLESLKKDYEALAKNYDELRAQDDKVRKSTFSTKDYSHLDNLELIQKIGLYESKLYELGIDPSKIK